MFVFATIASYVAGIQGRFERRDEEGITAIEYAVMAASIVAVIAAAMVILGGKINSLFTGISV
ncbi:MAG: Flp/Fap pilin component [Aeromicrobium sp.]|jgi:pilus assembly protein Flp/PilA|nr:Flp/Fap pilin component [Aeromicrobium sp.]